MGPMRTRLLGIGLMSAAFVAYAGIPALPDLPAEILRRYRDPLIPDLQELAKQRQALLDEGRALNADCESVDKGSLKHQDCLGRAEQFNIKSEALRPRMEALGDAICIAKVLSEICGDDAPPEPGNPNSLPAHVLKPLKTEYQDLYPAWIQVRQEAADVCTSPPSTFSESGRNCATLKTGFVSERFKYRSRERPYAARLDKLKKMFPLPHYQEYRHGLILGLYGIGGLNTPPGSTTEVQEHEAESFRTQQELTGGQPISPAGYDFIIGMATRPEPLYKEPGILSKVAGPFLDSELWRALRDNKLEGVYAAYEREIYPSIKGRSFDVLECHSNGAMVCLTALGRGDVAAREVRLFGPQITGASLTSWSHLVSDGHIRRVEIYWMDADPVPLISLGIDQSLYIPNKWPVKSTSAMSGLLLQIASHPSIGLHVLHCPVVAEIAKDAFACHRVQQYQKATSGK
jgi:hypothetical protein